MSIIYSISIMKLKLFFILVTILFSTVTIAATPFPGKLPANIVDIEAPNIIHVNIETWPGFRRDFRVTLPNLLLPGQDELIEECELELSQWAYDFTFNFLSEATTIHVKDMKMENSASKDAISTIYTNNGTLDNALRREKLAKPADLALGEPWCE